MPSPVSRPCSVDPRRPTVNDAQRKSSRSPLHQAEPVPDVTSLGRKRSRFAQRRPSRTHELLLGLFLLGALLFAPPLLIVFNRASLGLGIPTLFLYLFGVWSALIALVTLAVERRRASGDLDESVPHMTGKESTQAEGRPLDA
jgi:hypothetical protein